MLNDLPKGKVDVSQAICGYHQKHPGKPYAGCTCSAQWMMVTNGITDPQTSSPPIAIMKLAAVALGRLGGLKGGPARAKSMTAKQRSEGARLAAKARWKRVKGKKP